MSRETFLTRVRAAVAAGNRAGTAPPLPDRGQIGYQGAGPDPTAKFGSEWTTAGGKIERVLDRPTATQRLVDLVRQKEARRVLLGNGLPVALGLADPLRALGIEVTLLGSMEREAERAAFFAADLSITQVDHLIAETGSLCVRARPDEPRSLSLLPPVHLVVAERTQLVSDLFDLFEQPGEMPSCLSLITGPSKTGDIELRLVTGVHGPGEVIVLLID